MLKIGDKWKIGKWVDLKKWVNENFQENAQEIVENLVLKWKQKN